MESEFYQTLQGLIAWLTAPDGGSFITLLVFFSVLFEKFEFWHALKQWVKWAVLAGLLIVLGGGAEFLSTRPDLVAALAPFYDYAVRVVLAFLALDGTHALYNKRVGPKANQG